MKYNTLDFIFQYLLNDDYIWKVGLHIIEDGENIIDSVPGVSSVSGLLDLAYVVYPYRRDILNLKIMTSALLQRRIPHARLRYRKGAGRWDADMLTEQQIAYAAGDAVASLQIFKHLLDVWVQKVSSSNFVIAKFE